MHDEKIKVILYSGYKANERPQAFILYGEEIRVAEIIDIRIEESFEEKVRRRVFKVKGSDGYEYKIYCNEKTGEWYLS